MIEKKIVSVQGLNINFNTNQGKVYAVNDVSFDIMKGETLALVGESGCGKTVTALSLIGLLDKNANVTAQALNLGKNNLLSLKKEEWRKLRGTEIAMIFQNPLSVLNPVLRIDHQLGEVFSTHFPRMKKKEIYDKSMEMLKKVGVSNPKLRMKAYPHELSGGLRQRIMIAIALSMNTPLLIADEPTTALDATIQAQILSLLKNLQKESGMALLLITHDFGVVKKMAQQVAVMYSGTIVEKGSVDKILKEPKHPYTQCLIHAVETLKKNRGNRLETIEGNVPELLKKPIGCSFAPRCSKATKYCFDVEPKGVWNDGHYVCCHLEGKV